MIGVDLERKGLGGHSYCAHGEIGGSLAFWQILKEPALAFLHRLKCEYPGLEFEARVQMMHRFVKDDLVAEMSLTILSSNHPDLAQSLLQNFIDIHAHLVKEMRTINWQGIERFDENNAEHVQALKERCLQAGQIAYTIEKKRGQQEINLSVSAEAFACNMSIDDRFPSEMLYLEVGGSDYWWKWVQQMTAWWMAGYVQARSSNQATGM